MNLTYPGILTCAGKLLFERDYMWGVLGAINRKGDNIFNVLGTEFQHEYSVYA